MIQFCWKVDNRLFHRHLKKIDAGEIFIANKVLGDEKGKSFIAGFDREKMDEAVILKNVKYNVYGENVGIEFLQKNYN